LVLFQVACRNFTVANACSSAKNHVAFRALIVALRLPLEDRKGGTTMLMFKRSQLYIGLALAGLAEIIVRAVAH
jgi:hypothetical protein